VSAFIHRFPQLADMTFEDGTPFAGPDTKSWLARLSAPAASGRQESAPADQPALIKDLPPLEAITVLQDMLPQEGRGKERLAIYSAMCRAARDGRFWDLLVPLARHILELIAEYKLSGFDPEAVINILSPLRAGLGAALASRPDSQTRECLSEVSACLGCLRPAELLERGEADWS
jgi:type VI secretion system protein VasJ